MRRLAIVLLLSLVACGSQEETKLWRPGVQVVVPLYSAPAEEAPAEPAPAYSAPRPRPVEHDVLPSRENPPPLYQPPPAEPSVTSRGRLTDAEFRALQGVRQSLDSSIRDLERRSSFDDADAAEQRQLRALKARRHDILRRLRGG